MYYMERNYNEFMQKVNDGSVIITELALMELQDIYSMRIVVATDNAQDDPPETTRYYSIGVEYVNRSDIAKGKVYYNSECIDFSYPEHEMHNEPECLAKAQEVYNELLKKRVVSPKHKLKECL